MLVYKHVRIVKYLLYSVFGRISFIQKTGFCRPDGYLVHSEIRQKIKKA